MQVPTITLTEKREGELSYWVGVALDELVAIARADGCSESELEERLDDAFSRYEEQDA